MDGKFEVPAFFFHKFVPHMYLANNLYCHSPLTELYQTVLGKKFRLQIKSGRIWDSEEVWSGKNNMNEIMKVTNLERSWFQMASFTIFGGGYFVSSLTREAMFRGVRGIVGKMGNLLKSFNQFGTRRSKGYFKSAWFFAITLEAGAGWRKLLPWAGGLGPNAWVP